MISRMILNVNRDVVTLFFAGIFAEYSENVVQRNNKRKMLTWKTQGMKMFLSHLLMILSVLFTSFCHYSCFLASKQTEYNFT